MFRFLTRFIPVENALPGRWARKNDPKYCEWWMSTQHPEPGYPNTYTPCVPPTDSRLRSLLPPRADFWMEFWSGQRR